MVSGDEVALLCRIGALEAAEAANMLKRYISSSRVAKPFVVQLISDMLPNHWNLALHMSVE